MALLVAQIARACERHEERYTCVGGHVVGRFKVTGGLVAMVRHPLPQKVLVEGVTRAEREATER